MTLIPDPPDLTRRTAAEIREHKALFWIGGIVSVILGCLALAAPYLATLAAQLTIGGLLAIGGLVVALTAFRARRASSIAAMFVLGLLGIAAGVVLLVFPVGGILALTTVLIAFFLSSGATRLYLAYRLRPHRGWAWIGLGGLLSIALGAIIFAALPGSAFWTLGILVGIDFLFYGITLIALVMSVRDEGEHIDH